MYSTCISLIHVDAKRRALGTVFDTMAGNGGYTSKSVGLTDPSERDGFLSDIRDALGIARKLECSSTIVFSGSVVEGAPRKTQHDSTVEGPKRAADVVDQQGITFLLENIDLEEDPHYYLWSAGEGLEIVPSDIRA